MKNSDLVNRFRLTDISMLNSDTYIAVNSLGSWEIQILDGLLRTSLLPYTESTNEYNMTP